MAGARLDPTLAAAVALFDVAERAALPARPPPAAAALPGVAPPPPVFLAPPTDD
ncbi:MAG: OmpH family outer membrane protein, partial [Alphaproteobacteria bacterium]|nr:OmpH family outer membrane protein [Alphaproteobacteria bacterium]